MKKKEPFYISRKYNIRFNRMFLRYLELINKSNRELWIVEDFKDFAVFLGKKRTNYQILKNKIFGFSKVTEKDVILFSEKLNKLEEKKTNKCKNCNTPIFGNKYCENCINEAEQEYKDELDTQNSLLTH